MAEDIATLGIKVLSDDIVKATKRLDKLENQSKKSTNQNQKLGQSFTAVKVAITAFAGSLVVRQFMQTAGAFESMRVSLETVTGSAEKATMAMAGITEFAKNTPFQVSEITDAFIKLKALGIEPTEARLRSFGDTSSAMGKSLNQMIEAVADAATGEFERLKEFGIKARSEGDNVSFTFQGVTTTVKKNSEEITKYLQDIGDVKFAGAMSKQMETLNGRISNLGDAWDSLLVAFGETGALNLAKGGVDTIINAVKTLEEGLSNAEKLGAKLYNWLNNVPADPIQKLKDEIKDLEWHQRNTIFGSRHWAEVTDELTEKYKKLKELGGSLAENAAKAGGIDEAGKSEKTQAELEAENEKLAEERAEREFARFEEEMRQIDELQAAKLYNLQFEKNVAKERINVAKGLFGNLSTLMASESKKEFEVGKAAATATAVIKGIEAVQSSYAAGAKVGGPWVGAAYAAAAAIATAKQVQAIQSQQFGGGAAGISVSGGAGGGVTTGATFGGGAPTPPQQETRSGGTTTINLVGQDRTFSGDQIDAIFDEISDALERGDRVLFSSDSRQALELG